MAFRVRVTEQAEREIEEAFLWIARDRPEGAVRWFEKLHDRIGSLRQYPRRCRMAPESGAFDVEIRQQLHGPFRILFTIEARTVTILHVRHGSRRELRGLR